MSPAARVGVDAEPAAEQPLALLGATSAGILCPSEQFREFPITGLVRVGDVGLDAWGTGANRPSDLSPEAGPRESAGARSRRSPKCRAGPMTCTQIDTGKSTGRSTPNYASVTVVYAFQAT